MTPKTFEIMFEVCFWLRLYAVGRFLCLCRKVLDTVTKSYHDSSPLFFIFKYIFNLHMTPKPFEITY